MSSYVLQNTSLEGVKFILFKLRMSGILITLPLIYWEGIRTTIVSLFSVIA